MKSKSRRRDRYECLGGPLCGKQLTKIRSRVGFPSFVFEDKDGQNHFYRLARTTTGKRYWHYMGQRGIAVNVKPMMRPLNPEE